MQCPVASETVLLSHDTPRNYWWGVGSKYAIAQPLHRGRAGAGEEEEEEEEEEEKPRSDASSQVESEGSEAPPFF
jgi:hypothetical protein